MLASAAGERYDSPVNNSLKVMSEARRMPVRLLLAAAWLIVALLPLRAEPVDVGFDQARIDLLPRVEAVESLSPEATIELPATSSRPRQSISLTGRGPGPLYRWAVFTLDNQTAEPQELVIAASHQLFVGSRVLWPRPEGSRIVSLVSADGSPVQPLASPGADAYALTLPPGAMISYVLEVSVTGLDSLSLWRRAAFHAAADQQGVFRGMVLGIAMLLGISFICLFIVDHRAVFPAAALFGWSAIAFLVIEAGYLPALLDRQPVLSGKEQNVRAIVEALMLTGVIAALVSFVDLRRRMPLAGTILTLSGAAAAALALYGWFEPRLVTGLARIAFAAVVVVGLGLIVELWRRGEVRAQASLFGWIVLALWTAAAALGALGLLGHGLMHLLISAGMVLVLVTMGFTLAQFAFGPATAWGGAFEEAGRRGLALAASEQAVWDWQVNEGRLHVGPEIERALGLEQGAVSGQDGPSWIDHIHPADRPAYAAALEAAERQGRGRFSLEFRLRRADGRYRWFALRARALSGRSGTSRLIGTLADVTALRRSEDRLLADAVRDRLTGLPNRALFLDRLEQALRRARDSANPGLYVIAIGLERFKSVNDGLGPEAGDYLLSIVGRRLLACIGPEDTLARLSGDQFAVIWHAGRSETSIEALAEALGAAVAQPVHLRGGEIVVTASMGVARFDPEHRRAEGVLKEAEIALHEAKRAGYGAVEFFRPDMHDERSALLQLEQNLRRALERNEIEVVYQPVVRLADRQLAGFEALMRWRRGSIVLEPESFLGLAEETGIIRELGRYVLKEATARLGTWQRAFRPQQPLFVAVNISSAQLLNGDLVDDIQALIEREDLRPGSLKLELTESLVVQNPELAHKLLVRLKQMGVSLACDDFGTGYSGLESVFRLPFDTVKIDRCFLEGEADDRNWVVVKAILRLSRDLGLEVVAEGIETDEQMARLRRLGCEYGQGYLIGPPVMAQQVAEALGGHSYQAEGLGTNLAALWSRVTGRKGAAPGQQAPLGGDLADKLGSDPGSVALDSGPPENETAAAAQPSEAGEPEVVIDVRSIMPPPSNPSAPAMPGAGSTPCTPHRDQPAKLAEPSRAEVVLREADAVEPHQAEAAMREADAIEPNEAEAEVQDKDAVEPSEAEAAVQETKAVEALQPVVPATEGSAAEPPAPVVADVQVLVLKPAADPASDRDLADDDQRHDPNRDERKSSRSAGAHSLRRKVRRAVKNRSARQQ
jgi:diguanylate cyclase (GGDEF)-like protein/PAS domain S-box-containing protein